MKHIYLPPKNYEFEKFLTKKPKEYTKLFAKYLAALEFTGFPPKVILKAKQCILDHIGYSIAAVNEPAIHRYMNLIKRLGGTEESTIIGLGFKTSCMLAAMVNTAMGRICEMDLTHGPTFSHTGVYVISPAIVIAEREKVGGKNLIEGVVAGYEASLRVADSVFGARGLYAKGFKVEGTHCLFGAAAAAAKILAFDLNRMEQALSFAGNFCHGIKDFCLPYETPQYEFGSAFEGLGPMLGVLSALLVDEGFVSASRILEGEIGFWNLYPDVYNSDQLLEGIGEEFKILEDEHKAQSCCRFIHTAIEATLSIIKKYSLRQEDVQKVTIKTWKYAAWRTDNPKPAGVVGARFSSQFQIALTLAEGEDGLKKVMQNPTHYIQEKLEDPVVRDLMEKVKVVWDQEIDKEWPTWRSIVTIGTTDGKKYQECVDFPRGHPQNPMSFREVEEKFRIVTQNKMEKRNVDRIIKLVKQLDKLRDVSELTGLLGTSEFA